MPLAVLTHGAPPGGHVLQEVGSKDSSPLHSFSELRTHPRFPTALSGGMPGHVALTWAQGSLVNMKVVQWVLLMKPAPSVANNIY